MKLKLTAFALVLILAANANAGILRFTAKKVVKPAGKHLYHGAKKTMKVAKKVLY